MSVERAMPGSPEWAELAAPHLARYLMAAALVTSRRVLDVGCGAGYGAAILRDAGAALVHGVDADATVIQQASKHFATAGLTFSVDNCENMRTVSGSWDVITCFEVIEHLRQPEAFLSRAAAVLAPGGLLVVSTPDRESSPPFVDGRPRNPFHEHEWYRDEFATLLHRHFRDVEIRVQVESVGLQSRIAAVHALREGLMASNPVSMLAWRKWPFRRKADRGWTVLEGLAAPGIADFPVVPAALARVYGKPRFTVGLCRMPLATQGASR